METKKFNHVPDKKGQQKYALNKPRTKGLKSTRFNSQCINPPNIALTTSFLKKSYSRNSVLNMPGLLNKTNKLDFMNTTLTKKTVRNMKRYNTETGQSGKNINQLKKYIWDVTKKCNEMDFDLLNKSSKKLLDQKQLKERGKRFMMAQLSFAEIGEEKIEQQKGILKKIKPYKRSKAPSKMVGTGISKAAQQNNIEQGLLHSFRTIDKIYVMLGDMDKIGYLTKTNKSMIHFCGTVKFWLSEVFLKESSNKKDAFSLKTKYFVIECPQEVKEKLSEYVIRGDNVDLSLVSHDIDELLEHIESACSHKKIQEITKVEHYILSRLNYHKENQGYTGEPLRMNNYTQQHFNFCNSLSQLEEKYGPMREISKVSRNRFEDLNRTFQKLQDLL